MKVLLLALVMVGFASAQDRIPPQNIPVENEKIRIFDPVGKGYFVIAADDHETLGMVQRHVNKTQTTSAFGTATQTCQTQQSGIYAIQSACVSSVGQCGASGCGRNQQRYVPRITTGGFTAPIIYPRQIRCNNSNCQP